MTDEEILIRRGATRTGEQLLSVSECLKLARADEREKVLADMQGRIEELEAKIPPVGSGPWAIMQHLAGERLHHKDWASLAAWEPKNAFPVSIGMRLFAELCLVTDGWSVVEPQPETFDFLDACRRQMDGKRVRPAEWTGGEWSGFVNQNMKCYVNRQWCEVT